MYGNLSTTTATSEINENVESMSRFLTTNRNIELLEPYEGKLSCTVLRGEGGSNALDLPDVQIGIPPVSGISRLIGADIPVGKCDATAGVLRASTDCIKH